MTTETLTRPTLPPPAPAGAPDDRTAERLARLAARRVPSAPAPAPAGRGTGSPRPVPAAGRGGRRHAARGARAGALLMSLATTGGLTAFFSHQSAASTPLADAAGSAASTGVLSSVDDADTTVVPSSTATTATAATATATAATATAATATAATAAAAGGGSVATTAAATAAAPAAAATTGTATYTGSSVSTRYGAVQVAITVTDGAITDVKTLAAPSGGKNDRYTSMSVPVLRTEALAAQSADIDIVTGATYTSKGYITSLQSAVDQAVTAGALASA